MSEQIEILENENPSTLIAQAYKDRHDMEEIFDQIDQVVSLATVCYNNNEKKSELLYLMHGLEIMLSGDFSGKVLEVDRINLKMEKFKDF